MDPLSGVLFYILEPCADISVNTRTKEGGNYCWTIVRRWHRTPIRCPSPLDNTLWLEYMGMVYVTSGYCSEAFLSCEVSMSVRRVREIVPAVSHICNLIFLPSISIVRILKSMPIVVINEGVNWSSLNRRRRHDLPTPICTKSETLSRGCEQYAIAFFEETAGENEREKREGRVITAVSDEE